MAKAPYKFSRFGIVVHPWINRPDTKYKADGEYKAPLKLSGADAEAFKEEIEQLSHAAFEEIISELPAKDRKAWTVYLPYTEVTDDEGNPTGEIVFKFSQNAVIKIRETGEKKEIKVGIKDAKNQDMHRPIYSGTELRVMWKERPIKVTASKQAGVTLDFAAVQVRTLVSSSGPGFGEVEGYVEDIADEPAPTGGSAGEDY